MLSRYFSGHQTAASLTTEEVSELELCNLEVKMALARVYAHLGKTVPIKLI
jgi:hypothetical protein